MSQAELLEFVGRRNVQDEAERWARNYEMGEAAGYRRGRRQGYDEGRAEAEKPAQVLREWLTSALNVLLIAMAIFIVLSYAAEFGEVRERDRIDELLKKHGSSVTSLERSVARMENKVK